MTLRLPEPADAYRSFKARIPRECAAAFATALVCGILTHLYLLVNKLPNHDDILALFFKNDMLISGRWFLAVPSAISSRMSVPWVNGLLSLFYIALCCALIVRLLGIKRVGLAVLISALLVTFPVIGHTLIYMFTADAYCFALLLAVLGIFLAKRGWRGALAGGVLLGLSLACYQVYIFFAVALVAAELLVSLAGGTDSPKTLLLRALRYAAAMAIGAAVYLAGLKILLAVRQVQLTDYMGIDSMAGSLSLVALLDGAVNAYKAYFGVFLGKAYILNSSIQRVLFLLGNVFSLGLPLYAMLRRREKRAIVWALYALIALCFPLLMNGVYLVNSEIVHSLMLYPLVIPLILPAALYGRIAPVLPEGVPARRRQASLALLYGMCAMMTFSSLYFASRTNQTYLALELKFDNMLSLANRIVDRVEQAPEYSVDTPVWFQGTVYEGNYNPEKDGAFLRASDTPATAFGWEYGFFMNNMYFSSFVKQYVGVTFAQPDYSEVVRILETEEYLSMPYFPSEGSVKYIDGILFIRIGPGGTVL